MGVGVGRGAASRRKQVQHAQHDAQQARHQAQQAVALLRMISGAR